jgi:hypothetical protein
MISFPSPSTVKQSKDKRTEKEEGADQGGEEVEG